MVRSWVERSAAGARAYTGVRPATAQSGAHADDSNLRAAGWSGQGPLVVIAALLGAGDRRLGV